MEGDTSKEEETTGGPAGEPFTPPRRGGGNGKWFAIIGVLIIIVAALAVVDLTNTGKTVTKTVTNTVTKTVYPQAETPPTSVVAGGTYQFAVVAQGAFNNVTVWWGDGSMSVYDYTGAGVIVPTHTYMTAGSDYVYYVINYQSGPVTGNESLLPLTVGYADTAANATNGYLNVQSASASSQVANQTLYSPGTTVQVKASFLGNPSNLSYQVVRQQLVLSSYSKVTKRVNFTYTWFQSAQQYYYKSIGRSYGLYNISSLATGYNLVTLNTYTAMVNKTNGAFTASNEIATYYTMSLPSFTKMNIRTIKSSSSNTTASGTFTNAELAPGGYRYLDPQIAYDTVSNEILMNTLQFLVGYKGNSTTTFFPELAANMPSATNGGINNQTVTRTITEWNATAGLHAVQQAYAPGQVYTFHIRSNASWQDGNPVTAYDVYYAFARDMIFVAGPTGTPGWIQAQYLLPGNYYGTNTWLNITNNITYSNSSNTVTFYFQQAMPQTLVNMIFAASGAYIGQAAYYQANGENLGNSTASFAAYAKYDVPGSIPNAIAQNLSADGPYEINYQSVGTQIVFKVNPHFAPVQNYPSPSIANVIIKYVSSYSQSYLLLKSGQAQTGGIPSTSWSLVQHLQSTGVVYTQTFATPSIYWYNFNFKIDTNGTSSMDPSANLPSAFFDSWNFRTAFAYAYNYNYYMNYQVGNAIYGVNFGTQIAGMIPPGFAYFENMSKLNSTTLGVPYFSMAKAKAAFVAGMAHSGAKLGLSWSGTPGSSTVMYQGSQLTIPIAIYAADPVDLDGANTWATNLQQFGIAVDVIPVNFNQLLTFFDGGANPAAIWILGWAPDYPYPADYLQPMALPTVGTYPYGNHFNTTWFDAPSNPLANASAAAVLRGMTQNYYTAFNSSNNAVIQSNFQQMNRALINMTAYVYLFAANSIQIFSTQLNPTPNSVWQTNIMFGGGGDFFYQYFQYK